MWERYGVVIGLYGTDMVANYVKIEAMGRVWDLKLKLTFEWKTYGHIFSIMMDIVLDFHSLWKRYGIRTLYGKTGVISRPQIFHSNGGVGTFLLLYGNCMGTLLSIIKMRNYKLPIDIPQQWLSH